VRTLTLHHLHPTLVANIGPAACALRLAKQSARLESEAAATKARANAKVRHGGSTDRETARCPPEGKGGRYNGKDKRASRRPSTGSGQACESLPFGRLRQAVQSARLESKAGATKATANAKARHGGGTDRATAGATTATARATATLSNQPTRFYWRSLALSAETEYDSGAVAEVVLPIVEPVREFRQEVLGLHGSNCDVT
jgi:hypothetical protein